MPWGPVHSSMREISELIYETCKTYLQTQGKFILLLWVFIGVIAAIYFVGELLVLRADQFLDARLKARRRKSGGP